MALLYVFGFPLRGNADNKLDVSQSDHWLAPLQQFRLLGQGHRLLDHCSPLRLDPRGSEDLPGS